MAVRRFFDLHPQQLLGFDQRRFQHDLLQRQLRHGCFQFTYVCFNRLLAFALIAALDDDQLVP
jgi:hypothetical protein